MVLADIDFRLTGPGDQAAGDALLVWTSPRLLKPDYPVSVLATALPMSACARVGC